LQIKELGGRGGNLINLVGLPVVFFTKYYFLKIAVVGNREACPLTL
jgi:hypothetical protein